MSLVSESKIELNSKLKGTNYEFLSNYIWLSCKNRFCVDGPIFKFCIDLYNGR